MNAVFEKKLPIPMDVKAMIPLADEYAAIVKARDEKLKRILSGQDDKTVLLIGPCSADNEDSVTEYMVRLRTVQEKVKDKIFIVPRLYTNKPRTLGESYKGMLYQPDPAEKPDLFKGIISVRELMMRVLRETEFTCADEMLYPENLKYVDDLLGYVAVGARSVENMQHRLTASAVDVPVGMKNPTSGDLTVLANAVETAQHGHTFLYRGWQAHSQGNAYAHAVLRGYSNKDGQTFSNYHDRDLHELLRIFSEQKVLNPACIIDTNHANSSKQYDKQETIVSDVVKTITHDGDLRRFVKGFMVESYLLDGSQNVGDGCYGKSITDPCLGWEKTEELILHLAESF